MAPTPPGDFGLGLLLSRLFQGFFDIFDSMVGRMTVQVERPFCPAFPTTEPFFGRLLEGDPYFFLDLSMPGEHFLRGTIAPTQVNNVVLRAFT